MGYTHYQTIEKKVNLTKYKSALTDIRKLIKASPIDLGDYCGDKKGGAELLPDINFNGIDDLSHENFMLTKKPLVDFNFCKTAQKPYDLIVTACLAVLKDKLGAQVEVKSDGNKSDWVDGTKYANNVLNREIKNPIKE